MDKPNFSKKTKSESEPENNLNETCETTEILDNDQTNQTEFSIVRSLLECQNLLLQSIFQDYLSKTHVTAEINKLISAKSEPTVKNNLKNQLFAKKLALCIDNVSTDFLLTLLFLRIIEFKGLLPESLKIFNSIDLKMSVNVKNLNQTILMACEFIDQKYGNELLQFSRVNIFCLDLSVLQNIVASVSLLNFSENNFGVIGELHEINLSRSAEIEFNSTCKPIIRYKNDGKHRKSHGQFYTPRYIVDFLLQETLGPLLQKRDVDGNAFLDTYPKILDPSCGSGMFLTGALKYLVNWTYNSQDVKNPLAFPKFAIQKILYGVDINPKSATLCRMLLWLSAVNQDIFIPYNQHNIRLGNSLIFGAENIMDFQAFSDEIDSLSKNLEQIYNYDPKTTSSNLTNMQEEFEKTINIMTDILNAKIAPHIERYNKKSDAHLEPIPQTRPFNWYIEFPEVLKHGGFDIVIGNPPYFTEARGYKEIFRLYRTLPYTAKYYEKNMDIFYFFIEIGLDLLKEGGMLGFVVMEYWYSRSHASKLREKIMKNSIIKKIVNFKNYSVFPDAPGQHTSIIVLQKDTTRASISEYPVELIEVMNERISLEEIKNALIKGNFSNNVTRRIVTVQYSDETKRIRFLEKTQAQLIKKIEEMGNYHLDSRYISKGLATMVSRDRKGNGVFVLTQTERDMFNFTDFEAKLMKPFYFGNQLSPFYYDPTPLSWVIYSTKRYIDYENSEIKALFPEDNVANAIKQIMPRIQEKYPLIIQHLKHHADAITSDKKPYGLHRPKSSKQFETADKILSLRKTIRPCFTLIDIPYYMDDAVYYIYGLPKCELLYLLGLLNSYVMWYWCKYGAQKTHGNLLQIDKEVIVRMPLVIDRNYEDEIIDLVSELISLKHLYNNIKTVREELLHDDRVMRKNYHTTNLNQKQRSVKIALDNIYHAEKKLNDIIYQIYGLSEEDRIFLEKKLNIEKL